MTEACFHEHPQKGRAQLATFWTDFSHTHRGTHTQELQIPCSASTRLVGPSPLLRLEEQKCRTFW